MWLYNTSEIDLAMWFIAFLSLSQRNLKTQFHFITLYGFIEKIVGMIKNYKSFERSSTTA